jgi:hypothetical protein
VPGPIDFLLGILLPAIFCGGLLAAAERRGERLRSAGAGLAFGLAWFGAYVYWSGGLPAVPSADRTLPARDWLAWIVLVASVPSGRLSLVSRPILSAALAGLSLRILAERSGSYWTPVLAAASIWFVWRIAERWIAASDGPRAPIALCLSATGTSLASLFAHNSLIAALAGALAACLGAAACLALFVPSFRLRSGAVAVVMLVLCGCLLNDVFFASYARTGAVLLVVSVLAPGMLELSPRDGARHAHRWRDVLLAAGLALVPAALAVWIAWTPGETAYG